jgi:hypothetical protein
MINIEMASGETWFWSFPLLEFNSGETVKFDCREDHLASNFFN